MTDVYRPRRVSHSTFVDARGLRHHVRGWGSANGVPLVMLHGWMDVSASFQFLVDALARERWILAPDWRGFGLTERPKADCYWFPDYLGDLDAVLDALVPEGPVDLVGHSMGGNVAMLYAGVRPARVRRLVNLEGFGMRRTDPAAAPERLREWLDALRTPVTMRTYRSREEVAARLIRTHPRLPPDKAHWLAEHWSMSDAGGDHALLGDPAHKRVNPYLYRLDETLAVWRAIEAPVLMVEARDSDHQKRFTQDDAFEDRLTAVARLHRAQVSDAGHMLHHDQPERVAALIERFVDG